MYLYSLSVKPGTALGCDWSANDVNPARRHFRNLTFPDLKLPVSFPISPYPHFKTQTQLRF